jgi:hypothetical protein
VRSVWDREVGGSNPLAPTNTFREDLTDGVRPLDRLFFPTTCLAKKAGNLRFFADFIDGLWYILQAVFQFC